MSAAHRAYRLLARAFLLPLLGWLWWRGRKEPAYRSRLSERLGFIDVFPGGFGGVLIHAASVGEVQAARPLVDALLQDWAAPLLTISCQTPTGADTVRAHWGQRLRTVFFPVDTPGACARWLDRLQPRLVILVERELWPEMLEQCRERAIPVVLVNARLSASSARNYQRYPSLMRPVWQQLACVACADEETAGRFRQLGVPPERVQVTGNLKFDIPVLGAPVPGSGQAGNLPQAAAQAPTRPWPDLKGRTVIVAGSTHAPEEENLLSAWPAFHRQHPGSLLILVPRHPQRFEAVAQLLQQTGTAFVRRSTGESIAPDTSVFLADSMGELSHWYGQAQVCFIGGSLAPIGGHNAVEALALGQPVIFGQHTQNFSTLYADVLRLQAGEQVSSAAEVFDTAQAWLSDPSASAPWPAPPCVLCRTTQGLARTPCGACSPICPATRARRRAWVFG